MFHVLECLAAAGARLLRRVRLFATLWTLASQAPLSMGFSWQEYSLPFPPPGDLPIPGIEPWDQTHVSCISWIAGSFFTAEPLGKPLEVRAVVGDKKTTLKVPAVMKLSCS